MASSFAQRTIIHQSFFVFIIACFLITHSFAAPSGKTKWTSDEEDTADDSSIGVDDGRPDDSIWDSANAFNLDGDEDVSLNTSPETSRKRWIDDDPISHDDDDNHIIDGDESLDSDEDDQDPEDELVIQGINPDEGDSTRQAETTKDLVDDTLKLRHGRHTHHDDENMAEDDSDNDEPLEEAGNLQDLDEWPSEESIVPLEPYKILPYSETDADESDDNDLEDDDETFDESDDDGGVFSDDEENEQQKLFEDRVLMF